MIKSKLVLVKLRENRANVKMSIGLDLRSLQTRLNSECTLQEVQGGAHLSNTSIVASHIVEGHSLAELVVLAELLRLFEQVKSTVNVFFLEVINCKDVANFTQLLARAREFS